jgi:isopenicillin-N N-acyltransferase-like protein
LKATLIGFQIGLQHGQQASRLIKGSLAFYREYFERKSKMDWPTAEANARRFLPLLEKECPDLVDEMRGKK